jgi:hypothetical protein
VLTVTGAEEVVAGRPTTEAAMAGSERIASLAAVIDMDRPAHYLHWGVIQISVANLVVIILMIAVFVLALLVPFPGRGRRR